ncbi:MAG TPA: phage tail length tape measure family protein, partial [Micropruina sp.]|nr:phage tail length tape measure family protein [Micropruina sp.]
AWAAAFLSLKSAVDAAEALEVQMGKLRAVIKATGGDADFTAENIDRMARDIDEATLGGAANIRDAAVELKTFKSVGIEVFERTLRAAQDLSTAGFGAVEQTAVQLGKALEDPLTGLGALTRVGVSFNAQQKAQIEEFIKLGQVAEAQKVILAAVEGQVQGVAAAAGAGLAGAVDLVGKRFTDLKETIGGSLIGVLGQLNLQFADFLGWANRVAIGVGPVLRDTFVGIGIGVTALGGVLRSMTDALGSFAGAVATMDFSQLNQAAADSSLQIRGQIAAMAALSPTFADTFKLSADEAARLAALTGQAAAQTQRAGSAAGTASPQLSALAGGYEQAARSLEHLRTAQEAWSRVRQGEAALHGDLSEQLQVDIANAEQDANAKIDQSLAAANAALSAQTYYETLVRLGTASAETVEKAKEVAEARRAEAESTAAAAVEAGQYLIKARQAPQVQALATQTAILKTNLDYEARIAALRNQGLSQQERDSRAASAAQTAIYQATLLRYSITEKTDAREKKAILDKASALIEYAKASAAQVQNAEKGISVLGQLRAEETKLIQELGDDTDIKAMIEADDKPARKQAAAFIEWVGKQKAVINVELRTNKFSDGKSIDSLLDGLTRSANAQ